MTLKVIGAGLGRTGTYSLRLAINELGLGPCFHMEDVATNMPVQLPLWRAAAAGQADWDAIYDGFNSAVDWPTARFFRELSAVYPEAKFVLSIRDPNTWADSFGETIYKMISDKENAPPQFHDWLDMATDIITQTGIPTGADRDGLAKAFSAHVSLVQEAIPAERLLVFQAKEGWEPLCAFLGVPVPEMDFPRTNNRSEFWDLIENVK
ncbi:sulfotransferase family protein [Roseobacter sp.]|uniref:sulfotransferase family protein n=1 Tax=Roseobacter sp. TaxID=1907202 RepID=UPI00385A41A5